MSRRPIDRSPDLRRLQNEGYEIDIRGGYLVIGNVPYVDASCQVRRGILVSSLSLADDRTNKPDTHVVMWAGDHPCHADGSLIVAIQNSARRRDLGNGIQVDFRFSAKADYRDYHHKMTTYIARIAGEAAKLDPRASARVYPVLMSGDEASVFNYLDTASSRAGIVAINAKLSGLKIGIIGLGGTGAYVLDFVAKTNVSEIRIFDGDVFSQHNAFRAPGAPDGETLSEGPRKVDYLTRIYSRMHRGIVAHNVFIDQTNVEMLDGLDFLFICLDRGTAKRPIVDYLAAKGVPFIDVGMGLVENENELSGIVRTTTSTVDNRERAGSYISYADDDGEANEYATNIQIAELNALNAAQAVVSCKKLFGVYRDIRKEFYSGYSVASGEIVSEGME